MADVLTGLQIAVLGFSYLGLGLGYIPGLRMNRATIALVGVALLVALGTLSLEQAWQAIDANTIIFLKPLRYLAPSSKRNRIVAQA